MNRNRPGPNDACWCGSGRKYKKCHMGSDRPEDIPEPAKPVPARNPLALVGAERDAMRQACAFNAQLMDFIRPQVVAGISTDKIDDIVHEYTMDHGHKPATLGYNGFPKSLCTSVNEVVCHGIPDEYELKDGDIVNIDLTSIVDGWFGDQSETVLVGEVSDVALRLTQCSFDGMWLAIDAISPSCKMIEVGRAIENHARDVGFSVVRNYQGHGIGRKFHQEPAVPHFPDKFAGRFVIEPGICFTIEPMINEGSHKTELDQKDHWTVRTVDRKLSAQFEHTILMTEDGPEVMTLTRQGPQKGHIFAGHSARA